MQEQEAVGLRALAYIGGLGLGSPWPVIGGEVLA